MNKKRERDEDSLNLGINHHLQQYIKELLKSHILKAKQALPKSSERKFWIVCYIRTYVVLKDLKSYDEQLIKKAKV